MTPDGHGPADGVAIAVIAKAPVPGQVKTRMQPPLTPSHAADLAAAMLTDVTTAALATGAAVWWSYAGSRAALDALRPPGVRLLEQVGHGLGQRLAHTHRVLHTRGYDRVLVVGADCPTVDAAALTTAVGLLDDHAVVIGPASDGGYTLLGTTACEPALFTDVPMSTAHTGADTIAVAERLGLRVARMQPRPDLDTFADLAAALDAGWLVEAPRTRSLAERLVSGHGTTRR